LLYVELYPTQPLLSEVTLINVEISFGFKFGKFLPILARMRPSLVSNHSSRGICHHIDHPLYSLGVTGDVFTAWVWLGMSLVARSSCNKSALINLVAGGSVSCVFCQYVIWWYAVASNRTDVSTKRPTSLEYDEDGSHVQNFFCNRVRGYLVNRLLSTGIKIIFNFIMTVCDPILFTIQSNPSVNQILWAFI
jgi:hypothetical protein